MKTDSDLQLVGNPRPRTIIGGHSHIICMLGSLSCDSAAKVEGAVLCSTTYGGGFASDEDYVDSFVHSAEEQTAVVIWNGNQHIAQFLFAKDCNFRII